MSGLRAYRFGLRVGWQEWAGYWTWRSWIAGWALRMVAQACFFALLGKLIGSPERLEYLAIGNFVAIGVASSWAVPASTWDRYDGVYAMLVIAPTSILFPIVGRTSIWLLNSIATCLTTFIVLTLIFRLPVTVLSVAETVPLVCLCCLSYYCLALFMGSLVTLVPRMRNIVNQLAVSAIVTFCGVTVAVDFWPVWIEVIAAILPVTHGLEAIRLAIGEGATSEILWQTLLELLVALGWLTLAVVTMDRMANAGRGNGSIEFV